MSDFNKNLPYIFISYSHRDTDRVLPIIVRLRTEGFNVWYDDGIEPGSEWDENIATHIANCSYFISFISNNYLNSQNCKDELNYSRDLDKERLLVYLEDVVLSSGMAMRMNRNQAIYWNSMPDEGHAFNKLFTAVGIEKTRVNQKKVVSQPVPVQPQVKPVQQPVPVQPQVKPVQQPVPAQSQVKPMQQPIPVQPQVKPVQQPMPAQPQVKPVQQPMPVQPQVKPVQQPVPVQPQVKPVQQPAPAQKVSKAPQNKSKNSSSKIWLIIGGILLGLFLLCGIALLSLFIIGSMSGNSEPEVIHYEELSADELTSLADKGDTSAMYHLANIYVNGTDGIEVDIDKAESLYINGADAGDVDCAYGLACLYFQYDFYFQNDAAVIALCKTVLEYQPDNGECMNMIGTCYFSTSNGVEANPEEAFNWFLKAANNGNVYAMENVAYCYLYGYGVEKDENEGYRWYDAYEEARSGSSDEY